MAWEPAERVQKNGEGEYRALIGGQWVPVAKAQKNAEGAYRVDRGEADKPKGISPDFQRESAISATRGENPILSKVADVATGMSSSMRGIANLAEKGYDKLTGQSDETLSSLAGGEKPAPLGEKIWPKAPGSEGTGGKLVGSLADPVPWLIGGGIAKVAPYAPIGGKGFINALRATGRNALTGGTTGLAIGGVSDEGDAASGAVAGALLSAAIPGAGVLAKSGYNWGKKALAPATEAGRTGLARKFFGDNIDGSTRQQVISALMHPSTIIRGSPTTAADRLASANVGSTDKFGSSLVKAEQELSQQSAAGISDTAKSIAAQQEAARAAELAKVAGAPGVLESQVAARKAASTTNYEAAWKANVSLDPELAKIASNPYVKDAIPTAAKLAAASEAETGSAVSSSQFLHFVKIAIDKQLGKVGDTALADTEKRAAVKAQQALVKWLGDRNPAYDAARVAHEAASKPINQMKVGQELLDKLQRPLDSAERPTAFATAVHNAETKISKATGRPRLNDLTPDQRASIQAVQDELARNAEKKALGSGVNVKNLFDIAERGKGSVHLPNLLSRPAMITNWLMGHVGNTADDIIAQDVGKLMLTDPAAFAQKYLADIPPSQRQVVLEKMKSAYLKGGPYARASLVSASQNGE